MPRDQEYQRQSILTALVGTTIGGITRDKRNGLIFWGTDPRTGPLMVISADSVFDAEGMYFDTDEVKDDEKL